MTPVLPDRPQAPAGLITANTEHRRSISVTPLNYAFPSAMAVPHAECRMRAWLMQAEPNHPKSNLNVETGRKHEAQE
ncbi:hypothetical protein [Burkholderia lata]|uniref:hypothetical protein n=1 Tax=Burkholderia lata (strain ATCC 17760 / DSM 23089 / LMG 22485 / NCIMB 9086 / R18194 / 383) TaxID=482957 RepID=UPI0015829831|nr:hypothetical protein [Burkholderia lata]